MSRMLKNIKMAKETECKIKEIWRRTFWNWNWAKKVLLQLHTFKRWLRRCKFLVINQTNRTKSMRWIIFCLFACLIYICDLIWCGNGIVFANVSPSPSLFLVSVFILFTSSLRYNNILLSADRNVCMAKRARGRRRPVACVRCLLLSLA